MPPALPTVHRAVPLLLAWIVAAFLAVGIGGCGGANGREKAEAGEGAETPPVPVEVAEVARATVFDAYEGTTTLEAAREADIVAKVGGVVLELLIDEGQQVSAGQVVARLDRDRLALELRQARAELDRLEADFERLEELSGRKLVSRDAFDKARFDLERQRASLALAELELGYTDVRSPIDGVISERLVKVGKLVALHEPLFRVDDFDPLLAVLHAPERELNTLALGQEARLRFDAIAGEEFSGRLERISPVVDPMTGTFKVTVEIGNPDPRLKPGMFGRVHIVHDVHEAVVTVPREALVIEDRGTFVFEVDDGIARKRAVRTGYATQGRVEIIEGVDAGARVVTSGKGSLSDEAPIEVIAPSTGATVAGAPVTDGLS